MIDSVINNNVPGLKELASKWGIRRLAMFGSRASGDASEESDVDILVEFREGMEPSLLGHIRLENELTECFGVRADLSTFKSVEKSKNKSRKTSILSGARDIYLES